MPITETTTLIPPHGGTLCNLLASDERVSVLKNTARDIPSLTLNARQMCDLELLLTGAFSPLTGFLSQYDYASVVETMRLADGTLWPIPIMLDVSEENARLFEKAGRVALRDITGLLLAILTVEDVWQPDKKREAEHVFGTLDRAHPAVEYLMEETGEIYIGGTLEGIQMPRHYDFKELRHTPAELRTRFEEWGWDTVIGFQTRNPMHRAHKELTDRAAEEVGGRLLIHPVVGMTKPGDVDHYTRVKCYKKLLGQYPEGRAELSLLPLAMRMGGPREAVWHAIIRKNHGCTHFIVGRDHAGPGGGSNGEPIYGPYASQDLVVEHQDELGIQMVPFRWMVYAPMQDRYKPIDEVREGEKTLSISGTELRRRLATGEEIPAWFSYPEVVDTLRRSYPPRHKQGFTVFFTGLSGSGKSTLANALMHRLLEELFRPVTLLDGDVVRTHLSQGLGFSKEDRSTNVRRIGFVASEITKHGGVAICAPIAPYEEDRQANRELIESTTGGYIEVFVDAPLEVCEERDEKGLYAKARAGIITNFTGIDDPYEKPHNAAVICKTAEETVEESVQMVIDKLYEEGYLRHGMSDR